MPFIRLICNIFVLMNQSEIFDKTTSYLSLDSYSFRIRFYLLLNIRLPVSNNKGAHMTDQTVCSWYETNYGKEVLSEARSILKSLIQKEFRELGLYKMEVSHGSGPILVIASGSTRDEQYGSEIEINMLFGIPNGIDGCFIEAIFSERKRKTIDISFDMIISDQWKDAARDFIRKAKSGK